MSSVPFVKLIYHQHWMSASVPIYQKNQAGLMAKVKNCLLKL